jgi:hypothetical protein
MAANLQASKHEAVEQLRVLTMQMTASSPVPAGGSQLSSAALQRHKPAPPATDANTYLAAAPATAAPGRAVPTAVSPDNGRLLSPRKAASHDALKRRRLVSNLSATALPDLPSAAKPDPAQSQDDGAPPAVGLASLFAPISATRVPAPKRAPPFSQSMLPQASASPPAPAPTPAAPPSQAPLVKSEPAAGVLPLQPSATVSQAQPAVVDVPAAPPEVMPAPARSLKRTRGTVEVSAPALSSAGSLRRADPNPARLSGQRGVPEAAAGGAAARTGFVRGHRRGTTPPSIASPTSPSPQRTAASRERSGSLDNMAGASSGDVGGGGVGGRGGFGNGPGLGPGWAAQRRGSGPSDGQHGWHGQRGGQRSLSRERSEERGGYAGGRRGRGERGPKRRGGKKWRNQDGSAEPGRGRRGTDLPPPQTQGFGHHRRSQEFRFVLCQLCRRGVYHCSNFVACLGALCFAPDMASIA